MELLISENVARNLYLDVNDVVQKAFTVLTRSDILQKTEYTINPQMTRGPFLEAPGNYRAR